jgi:ferredoxin
VTAAPRPRRTLLAAARRSGLLVGHPCRGAGVCGRCTVEVLDGADELPPPDQVERALLDRCGLGSRDRISCLVPVHPGVRLVLRVGGAVGEVAIPSGGSGFPARPKE